MIKNIIFHSYNLAINSKNHKESPFFLVWYTIIFLTLMHLYTIIFFLEILIGFKFIFWKSNIYLLAISVPFILIIGFVLKKNNLYENIYNSIYDKDKSTKVSRSVLFILTYYLFSFLLILSVGYFRNYYLD